MDNSTANFLAGLLASADLLVDARARYGSFSLLAARHNPQLKILALEQTRSACETLHRNILRLASRTDNIQVRHAALSAESGIIKLSSFATDGFSCSEHAKSCAADAVEVEAVSIDGLLRSRKLRRVIVKIDADSHETLVGMNETLRSNTDLRLIVEFRPGMKFASSKPERLLDELDRLGFALFAVDNQNSRFCRLHPDQVAAALVESGHRTTLYCVPKQRATSVVFFAHRSQLAGTERSLIELIRELIVNYGVLSTVVAPSAGPFSEAVARFGASIIFCELASWAVARPDQQADFARKHLAHGGRVVCRHLLPLLRNIDPDVIFTHSLAIPWGALAAAILSKPHVWHVCEFGVPEHGVFFSGRMGEILAAVDAGSSFLLTADDKIRSALFPHVMPDRIRTVYRHIPMPDHVVPATDAYRSVSAIKLGIFGSLVQSNGQEDGVRAVAELLKRARNVDLLIAGYVDEPDYHARLLGLIEELGLKERVKIGGFLADLYPAMAATDIVLVCSRQEAFGRVAAEAMLLGRPVVYAATGGMLEYMEDGITGVSYRPGSVDELVRRIEELIDDPARAARIGVAAQVRAREKFTRYGGGVFRILQKVRKEPRRLVQAPPQVLSAMVDVIEADAQFIVAVERTLSWQITAPLRGGKHLARKLHQSARALVSGIAFHIPGKSRTHRKTYPDSRTSFPDLFEEQGGASRTGKPQQKNPESALPGPTHSTGDRKHHIADVYTVRYLYDAPGWAYYNNGRDLAKYAPPDFRVSLARFLSPSDLQSALGDEAPDFIILNRLSDVACVRQELKRRQWSTKLIGFWSAGWPRRIEQLANVVKHVDLLNFVNQAYWRNTGMLKNSVCIPLGVDLDIFRPLVPFADRPRRILWMGSELNSSVKGYEAIAVQLREKLLRAGFHCDFRVIDSFGTQILSQKEMVEWYNSGRLFLCTSTVEGTPNVALEAAACGCALISTRVGNMTELIRNGENGILVDPYFQAFYDTILRSEPRWPKLAKALRADISAWSWEQRSEQIFSALRALIEDPMPPRDAPASKPSSQGLVGSDHFRLNSGNGKADLSSKVTVFVTTVGSPTFELCLHFLEQQDCSFCIKVISNIAPMSAAFQRMLDDCNSEFFVQVDEDMLLYPHAVRTLFERMNGHAAEIALHVEYLYDTHLRRCIQGVKIFRTKIVKRYPFRNVQGCESDQIRRFRQDGFDYVVGDTPDPGDPYGNALGLHGTNFSREAAYLRYFVLQQRHRHKPWDWRMMTVDMAEQFRNEPSELNFFSLAGALAGLTLPVTDLGEKDFGRYSQTPGFEELARFYDVISGRKPVNS